MENKIIGGCRIIRKIGEGGMGIVYEAEQISLGRQVALKLLSSQLEKKEEDYEKRFIREAKSAARINHPNVVQVYDAGRDGDNLYLVMEFVDGMTLQKKILDGPFLPARDMACIMRDIASALYEAEKRKIVHRDMKPANVMITSEGILKVMDFGLAKQTDTQTHLTSTGKLLGTPYYMSPEQISGANVDSRSDLYSAGIILYFMLTKKRPFEGDLYTVIQKHASHPRPDPKDINPDASDFLRKMYIRMTKIKPEERYQSFNEIVIEAEKYLSRHEPAQKAPAPEESGTLMVSRDKLKPVQKKPEGPAAAPSGKSKGLVAGAAALGVLIVIVLFFVLRSPGKKDAVLENPQPSSSPSRQESLKGALAVKTEEEPSFLKMEGGVIVGEDLASRRVKYREKCSACGFENEAVKEALFPEPGKTRLEYFSCPKCSQKQIIVIENLN